MKLFRTGEHVTNRDLCVILHCLATAPAVDWSAARRYELARKLAAELIEHDNPGYGPAIAAAATVPAPEHYNLKGPEPLTRTAHAVAFADGRAAGLADGKRDAEAGTGEWPGDALGESTAPATRGYVLGYREGRVTARAEGYRNGGGQ